MDERRKTAILRAVSECLDRGAPLVVIHAEEGADAHVMTGNPEERRVISARPERSRTRKMDCPAACVV